MPYNGKKLKLKTVQVRTGLDKCHRAVSGKRWRSGNFTKLGVSPEPFYTFRLLGLWSDSHEMLRAFANFQPSLFWNLEISATPVPIWPLHSDIASKRIYKRNEHQRSNALFSRKQRFSTSLELIYISIVSVVEIAYIAAAKYLTYSSHLIRATLSAVRRRIDTNCARIIISAGSLALSVSRRISDPFIDYGYHLRARSSDQCSYPHFEQPRGVWEVAQPVN